MSNKMFYVVFVICTFMQWKSAFSSSFIGPRKLSEWEFIPDWENPECVYFSNVVTAGEFPYEDCYVNNDGDPFDIIANVTLNPEEEVYALNQANVWYCYQVGTFDSVPERYRKDPFSNENFEPGFLDTRRYVLKKGLIFPVEPQIITTGKSYSDKVPHCTEFLKFARTNNLNYLDARGDFEFNFDDTFDTRFPTYLFDVFCSLAKYLHDEEDIYFSRLERVELRDVPIDTAVARLECLKFIHSISDTKDFKADFFIGRF